MKLVIDANVLFSALIKNSETRKLIFNTAIKLYSPDFIIEEVKKYNYEIIKKSGLSLEEFDLLTELLFKHIQIINKQEYSHFLQTSIYLIHDKKDAPYLATALKLNCPIWSNDKELKKQKKVKIFTTEELLKESI